MTHDLVSRWITRLITQASALLCSTALFAVMALTLCDVSGRKLFSSSIPGSLELTEMLMVAVIFGALPLVTLRGEHVVFDSLDARLSARAQRIQQALTNLACAAVFAGLALLMWRTGLQFMQSGETSAQLKIPRYPFVLGMSVFCLLAAMAHALLAARPAASAEGSAL